MNSNALQTIINELHAHPKEREGVSKRNIDALTAQERDAVVNLLITELEGGNVNYDEPLHWMLGSNYADSLEMRLNQLPEKSIGRIFLPYFIFKETKNRTFLITMMKAIISGPKNSSIRISALGGYLRNEIVDTVLFHDFCFYLALNDSEYEMKRLAMIWLSCGKKLIVGEYYLTNETQKIVDNLMSGQQVLIEHATTVLLKIHKPSKVFDFLD
jgi:hypothetical protein